MIGYFIASVTCLHDSQYRIPYNPWDNNLYVLEQLHQQPLLGAPTLWALDLASNYNNNPNYIAPT
jgi:hypothetical protein